MVLRSQPASAERAVYPALVSSRRVGVALTVLLALIFSKFFYLASMNNYLTFYLMHHDGIGLKVAQYHLFYFLFAVAVGTLLGGPIGDRIGRRQVIRVSILGIAPFTLALPYVGFGMSVVLTMLIGFMLASAFPAMVVYAQELIPGKVETVSGFFFGLAFGLTGIGAAVLGQLADQKGINAVYKLCSFLPLLGLCRCFYPIFGARQNTFRDKPTIVDPEQTTRGCFASTSFAWRVIAGPHRLPCHERD